MCLSVADDRWDFVGNTIVTNNYVRLTSDRQSQKGAIWNIVVFSHCLLSDILVTFLSKLQM